MVSIIASLPVASIYHGVEGISIGSIATGKTVSDVTIEGNTVTNRSVKAQLISSTAY